MNMTKCYGIGNLGNSMSSTFRSTRQAFNAVKIPTLDPELEETVNNILKEAANEPFKKEKEQRLYRLESQEELDKITTTMRLREQHTAMGSQYSTLKGFKFDENE